MPPKRKSLAEMDSIVKLVRATPTVYTPLERHEYDAESLLIQRPTSPIECFSYFFDLNVWEVLCDGTNANYAFRYSPAGSSEGARGWKPVTISDLKIWIGLVIYMGIMRCPSVEDYWTGCTRQKRMDAMELDRFEQIQEYIHISLPETPTQPAPQAQPAQPAPQAQPAQIGRAHV